MSGWLAASFVVLLMVFALAPFTRTDRRKAFGGFLIFAAGILFVAGVVQLAVQA